MGHSISLLTASFLLAQSPSSAPIVGTSPVAQIQYVQPLPQGVVAPNSNKGCDCQNSGKITFLPGPSTATYRETSSTVWIADRPLLSRMQNRFNSWFGKSETVAPIGETVIAPSAPLPAGVEFRKLPTRANEAPRPGGVTNSEPPNAAPKTLAPVSYQTTTPVTSVTQTAFATVRPSLLKPRFAHKVGHEEDYSWITGQLEIKSGLFILHYASPETVDRFQGHLVLAPQGDMKKFRDGDLISVRGNVVQQAGRGLQYRATMVDLIEREGR